MAEVISSRAKECERIAATLRFVADHIDRYMPEEVCLEGTEFVVRVPDSQSMPTVELDAMMPPWSSSSARSREYAQGPTRGFSCKEGNMPEETTNMNGTATLAPPWVTWAREVTALFEHDEEVTVELDEDAPSLAIKVTNAIKADALAQIVPTEMQFGNVTLDVAVIPANSDATDEQVWRWAFDGNPALACTDVEEMPDGTPVTFAMFAPECAQWFADDLSNPLGLQTKTYEQIARDLLVAGNVRITSDALD